ncbi:winged helix-turn-helix transcriptional regulator [Streptomyces erythrochromogenes]|uniref:winged helix-turn-helix transcriptional regulator n=1 Tax=Streptomyces erythrochromogenes TaxID=285574 RepID=UPI003699DEAA
MMLEDDLACEKFAADCRARVPFEMLSNRWDSVVVYQLRHGPMRPKALLLRIGSISPKVLNASLRRLEDNGLVSRHVYAEAPPRVDYALTEAGAALVGPIREMGRWAEKYADALVASQDGGTRPPGAECD